MFHFGFNKLSQTFKNNTIMSICFSQDFSLGKTVGMQSILLYPKTNFFPQESHLSLLLGGIRSHQVTGWRYLAFNNF